jgi:hypothetical protein
MSQPAQDDLALAVLPVSVKTAAGTVGAAGFLGVANVLQIFATVRAIRAPFDLLPPVMGVVAVVALVSGIGLARARRWAPWAALASVSTLVPTTSFWFLFAVFNGLFTLFGLLTPVIAFLAIPFAIVGRKPCLATSDARRRLQAQGLELGV